MPNPPQGLAYLHDGSAGKSVTVHGDLNDNNVLLKSAQPQLPQPLPPTRTSCASARAAAAAAGQQRASLEQRRVAAAAGAAAGGGGGASGSQRGQGRCLDLDLGTPRHAKEAQSPSPHYLPASVPRAASDRAHTTAAEADAAVFSRPSSQQLPAQAAELAADAAASACPEPCQGQAQAGPGRGGLWVAGLTATGGGAAPMTACSTESGGAGHTPTRSLHLLATMTLTSLTGTGAGTLTGTGGWEAAQQQAANAVAAQSILSYVYKIADFGLSIQVGGWTVAVWPRTASGCLRLRLPSYRRLALARAYCGDSSPWSTPGEVLLPTQPAYHPTD